jgi:hypothetical protein
LVLPVVFIMVLYHQPPEVYNQPIWARMAGVILVGWVAAAVLRRI